MSKPRIVAVGQASVEVYRTPGDFAGPRSKHEEETAKAFSDRLRIAVGQLERGIPRDVVLEQHGKFVLAEAEALVKLRRGRLVWRKR